ncbi:hypothetical protein [Flavobacterium sp. DSR3-2]
MRIIELSEKWGRKDIAFAAHHNPLQLGISTIHGPKIKKFKNIPLARI